MNAGNPAQLYSERLARMDAAVELRATERVPFVYSSSFWSARLAGISFQEAMYDMDKYIAATRRAVELLQPDGSRLSPFRWAWRWKASTTSR